MSMAARRSLEQRSEESPPVGLPRHRTKLLFITITFHPEPGAMRGLPLARRLVESGDFDVTVLTAVPWYPLGRTYPGYRQRPWRWEVIDGVRVLRLPLYPSHDGSAARRIATYVTFMLSALFIGLPLVGRSDVVYHVDNLPTTGLVALLYGALRRVPVVQHVGDLWPDSVTASGMLPTGSVGRAAGRMLESICNFVYRRNARITVLSPGFRRMLMERGVRADRVEVLYNWAEEDRFFPAPYNAERARALGFAGRFNVVYAGNLGPLQSLETVVRAAAMLRDLPDLQIVIVGGGSRAESLQALAHELETSNVHFLGRRPIEEMNELNAIADVLLVHLADLPFLHSTIPSKVQVAFASGKPLLLGVRGDAAALVEEAGAGIVFVPDDPADLARALRRMTSMAPADIRAMGERGRAYYEAHLSLAVGHARMARLFSSVSGN
jgi:glycosyltransferase involved in cell wall biosynthesis